MHVKGLAEELPQTVVDALERGATIVAANQRAARTLQYAFDKRNRISGQVTWGSAAILSWDAWCTGHWQDLIVRGEATRVLLNRTQEHALWRKIVASDKELPASLHSNDSIAGMAADAWQLLLRHNGLRRLQSGWSHPETKAFQRWAEEFDRRCRTQQLLSRAALEDALRHAASEGRFRSSPIGLVGFDELLPAQRMLVDAISASGVSVERLDVSVVSQQRLLVAAENGIQEVTMAARWARKLLEEDPAQRVAMIVTSLETKRSSIDRIFREVLAPELQSIHAINAASPYEFSLGVPLSETPMTRIALDLVHWCAAPLPVERVSTLLVSPLFAMAESERNSRAVFDAFELRKAKLLRPEISLAWLTEALSRSRRKPRLSFLTNTLRAMMRSAQSLTEEQRPHAAWVDFIRKLLQVAQWGRSDGEDSVEFQTRQKWENTLDELITLDIDGTKVSFQQVLSELQRLTQQTMFAPESHRAPVQIMGPLEAAGSSFDAIWFLGAGDLGWPTKSTTSPLLPWALQHELGIPGAAPDLADASAQRITKRIAESATLVVFSYPIEVSEGTQRPSPLLQSLRLEPTSMASLVPSVPDSVPLQLEEFSDLRPLPQVPDHVVPGGAEILKLQAACGFRAFAERRLGSTQLREIELGMDAGERGNILHRVLEHFWKQVRSQSALKAMSAAERASVLSSSIEYGLQKPSASAKTRWEEAYVDLQRARLVNLINSWLDLELRREPFTVKFSEEETSDVQIGSLRLNLRVDRVDVTEDGEVILDYKTGGAKAAHWQSERPEEPQLPLYAVISQAAQPDVPLADLAFAQIRAGKDMALEGYTRKIAATGRSSSRRREITLEEQLVVWRNILEDLANDFHRGAPDVDPKNYPSTCAYCAQRILCRLNPAAFDEDLDEETTFDSGNG